MKRVIQCVYTKMEGDTFEFALYEHVGSKEERLSTLFGNSSKAYSFFTDLDDLEVGDLVIVQSSGISSRLGLAICQVSALEGLTKLQRDKAEKWVIQKIDLTQHAERMKRAAIEQEIRNKLRERKEEAEELMVYKALAQSDPEIAALLTRLAEFDPSAKHLLPEETKTEKK